jgi:hypothetical protein
MRLSRHYQANTPYITTVRESNNGKLCISSLFSHSPALRCEIRTSVESVDLEFLCQVQFMHFGANPVSDSGISVSSL